MADSGSNKPGRKQPQVIDEQQPKEQQKQLTSYHGNMMEPSCSSSAAENFMNTEEDDFSILEKLDDAFLQFLNEDLAFVHEQTRVQLFENLRKLDKRADTGINIPSSNIVSSQRITNVAVSSSGSSVMASSSNAWSEWPMMTNMQLINPRIEPSFRQDNEGEIKQEANSKGLTRFIMENEEPKQRDAKTLKRLAQNKEASRKSRLRKKAYVQELESSKKKLTQLEQELQAARTQDISFKEATVAKQGMPSSINSIIVRDATMFDMKLKEWQDDHHKRMGELRAGMEGRLPDKELMVFVDNFLGHYCMMLNFKNTFLKYDVFHFVSGMWRTPAERGLLWMGGCRPSEIVKIVLSHMEPSSDQQIMAICKLQHSAEKAEAALSQGLDSLYQFLAGTIASNALDCPSDLANNPAQMVLAMNKLSTLEGFMRQADNLRQHTVRKIPQILTTRQAARCFIGIFDHFYKLRTVSSLWKIGTSNRNNQSG